VGAVATKNANVNSVAVEAANFFEVDFIPSFPVFQGPTRESSVRDRALSFTSADVRAEPGPAMQSSALQQFPNLLSSLGVQTVMRSYEVVRVDAALGCIRQRRAQ